MVSYFSLKFYIALITISDAGIKPTAMTNF
jgi:hypothetical protein